jgi:uncharacterized cupredoxin-like copper-binding protein
MGIALPTVAGLTFAACGGSGHDMGTDSNSASSRTVNIQMTDLAFTPDAIAVSPGETVTFVFTNNGKVEHDAFIGDAAAQSAHAMEMKATGGSADGHHMADDGGISVKPGKTGKLRMTFERAGMLEIGCHEPGHYEAGMRTTLNVT